MMEIAVEREKSLVIDAHHWSGELKCNVCLDYFKEPHTLSCGHTFCVCCLKRLAQTARDVHYTTSFSKVKFKCPTCRYGTLAKPILKEVVTISYVLRDVVDGWKREKQRFCSENGSVSLKSVSSQTIGVSDKSHTKHTISDMETCERVFPDDRYITKVQTVTESEDSGPDRNAHSTTTSNTDSSQSTTDTASEWENFDRVGRPEAPPEAGEMDVEDQDHVLWSPGRVIMTCFWLVYTALVSVIAHGFQPYMLLYSLMFALILYAEHMPRRN